MPMKPPRGRIVEPMFTETQGYFIAGFFAAIFSVGLMATVIYFAVRISCP